MREKQPSIEERILDIEMKMAETGPWPADFPATSGELGVRIRAVVREMDRESSSRTREWAKQALMSICIDQYMRKSSSPGPILAAIFLNTAKDYQMGKKWERRVEFQEGSAAE